MNKIRIDESLNISDRKIKVIATLGPSSWDDNSIKELINSGVNCFRLNFSHSSHSQHLELLRKIRKIAAQEEAYVAILQDLCGPKIRISQVEGERAQIMTEGHVELKFSKNGISNSKVIYVEGVNPSEALEEGQCALLSDGSITLIAVKVSATTVHCKVLKGGWIRSRVGIAFPDTNIQLSATTEKDFIDLEWGIANKVDYVALSFVQDKNDIDLVKQKIKLGGSAARVIAKIERKKALTNIDGIIGSSDGLMIARGDLGLELPLEKLPQLQRELVRKCNHCGIPVIVATQMLHSMVSSNRPTRAEVSDVASAVISGADVLMLSDETAIGENPVNCVQYLSRIALESEKGFAYEEYKLRLRDSDKHSVPDAIAYAACAAATKLNAKAIIACTETGTTVRLTAKYRPQQPLFGASANLETLQRMSLMWGITPIKIEKKISSHDDEIKSALNAIKKLINLNKGDKVIIMGGMSAFEPGSTSNLQVVEI